MSSIAELARPEIKALRPYQPAAARDGIRLNANEAPWRQDWDTTQRGLNRYPEPWPAELVAALADLYGVETDRIAVTRGSDDAIDLLVRVFCRPGVDRTIVCPPTFGMYRVAAQIQGAMVDEVPLLATRGFELDVGAVLDQCDERTKIIFLCSPNNPTGNSIPAATVEQLCSAVAATSVVVVDEAYIEFSELPSAAAMLDRLSNLAVLRTLSKAHALAGARVGSLLAAPSVVDLIRAVMPPYALPSPSIDAALGIADGDYAARIAARVATTRSERARLERFFSACAAVEQVWPSDANFLLVRFADPDKVLRYLAGRDILVRDFSTKTALSGCIRVSVGDRGQNDALIAALGEMDDG